MAMRHLLRRIAITSPSGPHMRPLRGASPVTAAGAPKFHLSTLSKDEFRAKEEYLASIHKRIDANFVELNKLLSDEQFAKDQEDFRLAMEDLQRYGRNWVIFGCGFIAASAAITVPLAHMVLKA